MLSPWSPRKVRSENLSTQHSNGIAGQFHDSDLAAFNGLRSKAATIEAWGLGVKRKGQDVWIVDG